MNLTYCEIKHGKIKRTPNKNRGYCGWVVDWQNKKHFLRSKLEFYFFSILNFYKIKFDTEIKIYYLNEKNYKPDFFIYDKKGNIKRIIEIKSSKKEADEYLKMFKEEFNKIGIDYWVIYGKFFNSFRLNKFVDLKKLDEFIKQSEDLKIGYKGEENPMFNMKHSKETLKKIGEKTKERMQNEKWKKQWLEKVRKTNSSQEIRNKKSKARKEYYRKKREELKKNNPDLYNYLYTYEERECLNCNKKFSVLKKSKRKFCSQSCATMYYAKIREKKGEKIRKKYTKESYNKGMKNRYLTLLLKCKKYISLEDYNNKELLQKKLIECKEKGLYPKNQSNKVNVILKYFKNFEELKNEMEVLYAKS